MRRTALIALAALALAGCGSGNSGGSSNSSAASSPTLYTFSKDTSGKSNCSGACAKGWPPATSATGLDKGKLTTIKRPDGTTQVALSGRPLYRYAGDTKPGDANGDGSTAFGGTWKAVTPTSKSGQSGSSRSYGY